MRRARAGQGESDAGAREDVEPDDRLGRNEIVHGRQITAEEIEERIDAVTAGEVQELASELLATKNLGLCIIGPVDESAIAWNRDAA